MPFAVKTKKNKKQMNFNVFSRRKIVAVFKIGLNLTLMESMNSRNNLVTHQVFQYGVFRKFRRMQRAGIGEIL